LPPADYRLGGGKPKRRQRRAPTAVVAQALNQEAGYASQGRAVAKAARRQRGQASLKGALASLPTPQPKRTLPEQPAPGVRESRTAKRRMARAAPELQLPTFPTLAHPSAAQRQAIVEGVHAAIRRAGVPGELVAAKRAYGRPVERQRLQQAAGARRAAVNRVNVKTALRALGAAPTARPRAGRSTELAAMGAEINRGRHPVQRPGTRKNRTVSAAGLNLNLDQLQRGLSAAVATHITGGHGGALKEHGVLQNAGRDVLNFPRSAVQGLYEVGAAGADALRYLPKPLRALPGVAFPLAAPIAASATASNAPGSTKRARRLADAQTRGPIGELVAHGDPKAALKSLREHPVYGGLEALGAYGAVGRVLGAGARAGLAGARVRAFAQTARPDLELVPGMSRTVKRSYSKNLLTQVGQKTGERSKLRRGLNPNEAHPGMTLPIIPGQRTRKLRSEADEFGGQVEAERRVGREEIRRESRTATKRPQKGVRLGKPEQGVVHFAVERRLRPGHVREDLGKVRARLQNEYETNYAHWKPGQRADNRRQVKALDEAIKAHDAGHFDEAALAAATDRIIPTTHDISAERVRQGIETPQQSMAATVRPYAVEHMGARHETTLPPEQRPSVARHEQAQAQVAAARAKVTSARRRLGSELRRRDQRVGKHRVQSGRDQALVARGEMEPRVALRRAAERDGMAAQATRAAKAAREDLRVARRELGQARKAARQARPVDSMLGLVDAKGNPLSTRQVVEHMQANKVPMGGFLSHAPTARGARAYFQNFLPSRKTSGARRTGEATRIGAHGVDRAAIEASMVSARGASDAVGGFDRFAGDFGLKHPDGRLFTPGEAARYADEYHNARNAPEQREELVPVQVGSARYTPERLKQIEDAQASGTAPDLKGLMEEKVRAMLDVQDGGTRNVVLVPRTAWDRFVDHQFKSADTLARAGQKATGIFRGAVLPFSTKWLTGNVAEAVLRSGFAGIHPGDVVAGRRLRSMLSDIDQAAARTFNARARGGLLYGSSDRLSVFRDRLAFESTALEGVAHAGAILTHTLPMRAILGALDGYQRGVFALNKAMEQAFQDGVIGKQARVQIQEMTGSWQKAVRYQRAAMLDVARGLRNTPNQVRFARAIDETLGKYTRFSPAMRRTTQTIAPFLPWYVNSLRFVYHTLPAKHPVKTALLVNVEREFERDVEAQRAQVPPGDLGSAIPTKDGGYVPAARYSPFGAFTGNLPEAALEPFLPQFSTVYELAHGRDWTGKQVTIPGPGRDKQPSGGQKAVMAMYAGLESVLPGLSIARRLQERGETSDPRSTVWAPKSKPGTAHGPTGIGAALNRVFNPVRPVYLSKKGQGGNVAALRALTEGASSGSSDPVLRARQVVGAQQQVQSDPEILKARRAAAGIR
jgi:hypothetical protein